MDHLWRKQECSELLGKQIRDRAVAKDKGVLRVRVESSVLLILLLPCLEALSVLSGVLIVLPMLGRPRSKPLGMVDSLTVACRLLAA